MPLDDAVYDSIIDYAIHKDLSIDRTLEIEKGNNMAGLMLDFIKKVMDEKEIHFVKSSKYFLQTNFMKIQLNTPHSTIEMFFQLVGTSRKNEIDLTCVLFLKDTVLYQS